MGRELKKEEVLMLEMLRGVLVGKNVEKDISGEICEGTDWASFIVMCKAHEVSALLYEELLDIHIPDKFFNHVRMSARQTVLQNYRLLLLNKYITEILDRNGIHAVTLKGAATASRYSEPETRKSGDVDIMVTDETQFERACSILLENGLKMDDEQHAQHHVGFLTDKDISVELHSGLADPFDNDTLNKSIEAISTECKNHIKENNYWGFRLYEFDDAYHAYYLLVHMLQHFLREGFGVRNLCDWAVFWNGNVSDKDKQTYMELVKKSGIEKFSGVITKLCVDYLGLESEKIEFMGKLQYEDIMLNEVLCEILDAGDFGKKDGSRMLIVKDKGIKSYIREFHRQMHANFPRAGKIFLIWPILWLITLVRFMHNNRTIRHVSMRDILKNAGNRSNVIKDLDLFD